MYSSFCRPRLGASRRWLLLASLAAACGVLAAPSTALGAVTIGSDLGATAGRSACNDTAPETCTAVVTAIPGRAVTSPIDGVVVRWRLSNSGGTFSLRVVRPAGGPFTGAGTSAPVTVETAGPTAFDTRLPIKAGDHIGVNLAAGSAAGYRLASGAQELAFFPPLGDGETRAAQFTNGDLEDLVNADIEPDVDGDGFGDETQDLCAKDATTQALCKGPCSNERRGTEGPDTVAGTPAGDNIFGLGGNDQLSGLDGEDCLFGGAGQDRLVAGAGDDRLSGEAGPDTLEGGDDDDRLSGGADNDQLVGGADDDQLGGGAGNDVLRGGTNKDLLRGEGGNDTLRGQAGDDRIVGGGGNDKIDVGKGKNRASGGGGRDVIRAVNRRRDRISCGAGRDTVRADASDRVSSDCERVNGKRRVS